MSLLTEEEREEVRKLKEGSYYGQIGITIRFGNHFWHECSGSLLAGSCGGDNLPTLLQVRKRKKTSTGPDVRKRPQQSLTDAEITGGTGRAVAG